jgi:hypothetical protein
MKVPMSRPLYGFDVGPLELRRRERLAITRFVRKVDNHRGTRGHKEIRAVRLGTEGMGTVDLPLCGERR